MHVYKSAHRGGSVQKGRKLVEKLHAAQDEARALEAQLQARDESLAQASMHAQHALELRDTCVRLQAHIQQLEQTVEDLVTSAATLAKVRVRLGTTCSHPAECMLTMHVEIGDPARADGEWPPTQCRAL